MFRFFNFLNHEIAIDLGTANTLIMYKDQVVVDQPSIVAKQLSTGKFIAVGDEAMEMHERTHEDLKTIRPLKDGVIADFNATDAMLKKMIAHIYPKRRLFHPSYKMVICIPSGITEVEKRAVFESAQGVGSRETFLIKEPMSAALGIGIDVSEPKGNMIIDIGGGTTEIAVISLMGIVEDQSIRIAGDEFTNDVMVHIRRQHNMLVGERTAENIKISVGSALPELEDEPESMAVNGRDLMTGIPKQVTVGYSEIARALDKSIIKTGIYLTGGGALLRGLDKRISLKTKLPVHVPEDPLRAVVRGTGLALKRTDSYRAFLDKN